MKLLIYILSAALFTPTVYGGCFDLWVDMDKPVNTWAFTNTQVIRGILGCPDNHYICVTRPGNNNCYSWSDAGWNTGKDWGYKPKETMNSKDKNGKPLKTRLKLTDIGNIKGTSSGYGWKWCNGKLVLNLTNSQPTDLGKYVLSIYPNENEGYKYGHFCLKDIKTKPTPAPNKLQQLVNEAIPIPGLEWKDVFSIETQANPRKNLWIEWVRYNVRVQNISIGCVACAAPNAHLYTHAFPADHSTTLCLLGLLKGSKGSACPAYIPLIREKGKVRTPGDVIVTPDNYTCYSPGNSTGSFLGVFEDGFCKNNETLEKVLLTNHSRYMYDIYWLCGDGRLRSKLPMTWTGQCTLVKLAMQFRIIPWDDPGNNNPEISRSKRSMDQLHTDYTEDPKIFIDSIGVPRGVPDEFKAQNQILAGFRSIIPQVQINYNVDWINYIYYIEQRFINFSQNAFQGIVEELGPNTRMTLQNRLAIDMILAEKGGVCGMIGEECCTYIPQNSEGKGKTMIALTKIKNLARKVKENAGVDTSFFSGWLGGFKGFLQQACLVVAGLLVIGLIILCCVVPIYRKIVTKAIDPSGTFIFQEIEYVNIGDMDTYTPPDILGMTHYDQLQTRELV